MKTLVKIIMMLATVVASINVFTGCKDDTQTDNDPYFNLIGTTLECKEVMGEDEINVSIYFMGKDILVWNDHEDDIFEMYYIYNAPIIYIY